MTWTLSVRYRNGVETSSCCGSRLAADRLAAYLVRRHRIARWQIVEGTAP